ncbi:hypothetical protein HDU76_002583, partial [Blyttiomyces sp. JEL0837]
TIGVSPARLKSELSQWLELHLKYQVPSTLLILSRAFTISEKIPASADEALKGSAEALQATLSALPDQVVNEAQLKISEVAGTATYQQKLNVLQQQEELIADELEQEAAQAAAKKVIAEATAPPPTPTPSPTTETKPSDSTATSPSASTSAGAPATGGATGIAAAQATATPIGDDISQTQLKQIGEAIKIMAADSAVADVKQKLEGLKEERKEYKEDIDELALLTQKQPPKVTTTVSNRVDKMIAKIESELKKYDTEVGSKLNLIKPDESGRLTVEELETALKVIRDNPGDDRIKKIVRRLDTDGDGVVSLPEILSIVEAGEGQQAQQAGQGQGQQPPPPAPAVASAPAAAAATPPPSAGSA